MPASQQAADPTVAYEASQAALSASLMAQVERAWARLLHTADLRASLPKLSAGITALVHRYGSAQALAAAEYYLEARAAAGVTGKFTPVHADPAPPEQVQAAVEWATRGLWSTEPDPEPALVMTQGAAQRMALDTGRDTILGAVRDDRKAIGWAREPKPGACYFCLLMATRGAAYKSKKTASFEAHDHDRCVPVPVFTAYEPPAEIRHWQSVYRQAAKAGSGKAVIREFRRLVEAERSGGQAHPGG